MSRRRRSDQMGMEIRLAADAVPELEGETEDEDVALVTSGSPNGSAKLKKKRVVRVQERERGHEEDVQMDEQARKVDEMVDSVKRGGVCSTLLCACW